MKTCTQCGTPIASDSPGGLCARCLLSVAIKDDATATVDSDATQPGMSGGSRPAASIIDIANAAEIARRLPQFEIIELLGRGGMGVVYKATQVQLDRTVALKILPPSDATSPGFVERFRREARSLAKLSHPNIVHVYDFGETNGLYYFVMEYVDGPNLRSMIHSQRMKPAEALAIVPKICDALEYAHEEGVVHRDIKPENILIDKKGRVKIADFGLAKLLGRTETDPRLTVSGATLGTPRYMAPEQVDKPQSVDHRADIYSLGVVFYEMLTGELPMGRFAPPSHKVQIDVRLDEIVLHALEPDVKLRYQHASEVRQDVENVTSKSAVAPEATVPRPASIPAQQPQASPPSTLAGIHRIALVGAVLLSCGVVCLIPVIFLGVFAERGGTLSAIGEFALVGSGMVSGMLLLGAAICGFIAITEIKRSGGKIDGLQIAAGTVLVPALLLAIVAAYFLNPYVPFIPDYLLLIIEAYYLYRGAQWGWYAIVGGGPPPKSKSGLVIQWGKRAPAGSAPQQGPPPVPTPGGTTRHDPRNAGTDRAAK